MSVVECRSPRKEDYGIERNKSTNCTSKANGGRSPRKEDYGIES